MKLEDARVVLTGAAGGIGSAVARRLAAGGAKLLLTDLRQEPLDRLAAELASPAAVLTVAADVGSDAGRTTLASAAHDFGANVLINAAGINPFGLFEEQSAGKSPKLSRSTRWRRSCCVTRCYRSCVSSRAPNS
jgi:NAD(P)-dependent dehydrogenase (short-subunit alcohol dehydrogenase family)